MKFLDRFRRHVEQRSTWDQVFPPGMYAGTASGQAVAPRTVENLSTVIACVNAVATALASLPAYVHRLTDAGREDLPNHPVARLVRRPNERQTWPDWLEWTMGQVLMHGNAVSVVEYDGAGRPTALLPVPWGNVQPVMLPSGRLAYDVIAYAAPWGGRVLPRRYLDGELFHLKDRSDDGFIGRSRLSRAPEVLGSALALQEYTGAMWKNGATPSGALKFPTPLNKEQLDRIRAHLEQRITGSANARRVMILEGGAEFQAISISPEDAEVLQSRRFTVEELCRLYQVPPPIVQDYTHNTFTNAQQAALWFAQFSLTPWARKIEAEFSRTVFGAASADCELCIDLSGLMRGDYSARWQANVAAVDAGILTADEVRAEEGYNPLPAKAEAQPATPPQGQPANA